MVDSINLNTDISYLNSFQNEKIEAYTSEEKVVESIDPAESRIHNSAVNVAISTQSLKMFLNIKSVELTQGNTSAQNALMNIINNTEIYDFLSGKETENGFSLKSIGYEGKAITELNPEEAKALVSEEGFFGVSKTSNRVASFVIDMATDNVEALQEARKGIIQGFEDAKKLWGGELPDISYETQEKTLQIIDEKIEELLKTDTEKDLEIV